jgi:hypothetical protein
MARQLFPLLGLAWLLASLRVKRPAFLLLGVLAAITWTFGVTHWPMRSVYGLLTSNDRVGNLALVQVVAAGNSPLRTAQLDQLHFEPLWGLLVAFVSGFEPERVLALYPFLPLLMCLGFALSLYFALRGPEWSAWERVLIAAFATLLSSAPLEHAGTYRVPWAMTFLLKPNHSLGFALLPPVLLAFSRMRGWRGRVAVGLLLHVLGWVFVIHMAFAAAGFVLFAAGSLLARREDARRDVTDAAVVIGVNVLVVSPYLVMLLVGYPFLYASPRAMIPPFSAHLLEGTLKQGAIFWLGAWGALLLARRDRLGRVFAAQLLAGYAVWACVPVLSLLQIARERDEIYYWIRFLTAAAAGVGAYDLIGRAAAWLRPALAAPPTRCAAALLVALPWSLPYWWNPLTMDSYVPGSLEPVPERLRAPTDFIRRNTPRDAVFAGDREYARYVAALGARRSTLVENLHPPKQWMERVQLEVALLLEPSEAARLAAAQGVSYFVVTPRLLAVYREWLAKRAPERGPPPRLVDLERRDDLERAFLWQGPDRDFVAVFKIRGAR